MSGLSQDWHLDKKVPLAMIFAIAAQFAGVIWVASSMNERLLQVETKIGTFALQASNDRQELMQQSEEIAVLASQMRNTNETIRQLRDEVRVTNELLRQMLTRDPRRNEQ